MFTKIKHKLKRHKPHTKGAQLTLELVMFLLARIQLSKKYSDKHNKNKWTVSREEASNIKMSGADIDVQIFNLFLFFWLVFNFDQTLFDYRHKHLGK